MSEFLSDKTWVMPVGQMGFMIETDDLPKKEGFVWYRRLRYVDQKGRKRSARVQMRLQGTSRFSGLRLSVAYYKRCRFWDRLGRLSVLVRKFATASFTRNAATAGREQSVHNGAIGNAEKQVVGTPRI